MKAKVLKIFVAILLIITLTSANFILIGFNSISYAVEKLSEDKDTSHKNIEFMAYFKDDSQNETMESSTTTEKTDLKLYFNVNVKQEGYFDGKITLKDSNFKFKTDTENERIQNITEDTITLNQINAGDIVEIPVGIELVTDTSYDISLLNAESKLELTGTYKDSTEKDITVTGTRTVNLKITSPYNEENNGIGLEQKILTNKVFNYQDGSYRIVQLQVESTLDRNLYPIKTSEIELNAPKLTDGKYPITAIVQTPETLVTNGKAISDEDYKYDSETGKTIITIKNEEQDGKVVWNKSGSDKYIITYVFDSTELPVEENIKATSKISLYDEENTVISMEKETTMPSQELDAIIETNVENSESEIYKGKIYEGIDREFTEKITLQVNLNNIAEQIILREDFSGLGLSNVYTKNIVINRDNMLSVLGEGGTITILNKSNNQELTKINKDTEQSDGNIIFNIPDGIAEIVILTSKPEKTGTIEMTTTKVIKANDRDTVKAVQEMKYGLETTYKIGETETSKQGATTSIKLLETQTTATLQVNKDEYSTMTTNENVEFRVVLNTNNEKYELYKNPHIQITIPQEFEKVEITSINLVYEDELKINPETARIEGNVINLDLEGEQTSYKETAIDGATIIITANLTTSRKQKNLDTQFTLTYTNEKAVNFANGGTSGQETKPIKIVSYAGLITTNKIEEYNLETINNEGTDTAKLQLATESKKATVSSEIINNKEATITNVRIIGTFPTENAVDTNTLRTAVDSIQVSGIDNSRIKIYYTENENATVDLQNVTNGWEDTLDSGINVKKYMIVIDQLSDSEALSVSYNLAIPSNLEYNESLQEGYTVYYINEASVEETMQAKDLKLETGAGPIVDVTLNSKLNGQNVDVVHEGEAITYEITAENTGSEEVTGLKLVGNVPEGTTYVTEKQPQVGVNMEEGYDTYPDQKTVEFTDIKLQPGEKVTKTYLVRVNTGIADTIENIQNQVQANYGEAVKTSNTVETKIEKADISLEMLIADNFYEVLDPVLDVGSYYRYGALIKNISGKDLKNVKVKVNYENVTIDAISYINDQNEPILIEGQTEYTIPEIAKDSYAKIYFSATVEPFTDAEFKDVKLSVTGTVDNTDYYSNQKVMKARRMLVDITNKSLNESQYVKLGDEITYQITVTNNSSVDAPSVTVTDLLSEYLVLDSVQADGVTLTEEQYMLEEDLEGTGNYITIEDSLSAGQTKTYTIKTYVEEYLPAFTEVREINNTARVSVYSIETGNASVKHLLEPNSSEEDQDDLVDTDDPGGDVNPGSPDDGTDNGDNNNGNNNDSNNNGNTDNNQSNRLISGTAWLDQNENGKYDKDEQTLQGITVKLFNVETNTYQTNSKGEEIKATTNESGLYTLSVPQGKYIIIFEYDKNKYVLTSYESEGAEEDVNSKVLNKDITIDGNTVNVDTTEIINVENDNISYINIGLKERKRFDMKLDKTITRIVVQNSKGTQATEYQDATLAKAEIDSKLLNGTSVVVEYKIKVTNEGEIAGYVRKIADYISADYKFSSELNKDWYQSDSVLYNDSLANEKIEPGESKELTLILTKQMSNNNTGLVNNTAEIVETFNENGLSDADSAEGNRAKGEDDMGSADVILSIKTGQVVATVLVVLTTIAIIGAGAYIIVRKFINKEV